MFGGLVEEVGVVQDNRIDAEGRLHLACRDVRSLAAVGDSIAVNGCCLTVAQLTPTGFVVDVMPETGRRTNLGALKSGEEVDLEASLRLGDRLGGHLLSGHVDAVAAVVECHEEDNARWVEVEAPAAVAPFLVPQGSIAVDGISLTVVRITAAGFSVSLIPHTQRVTVARHWMEGSLVNLEADLMARHVHRAVAAYMAMPAAGGAGVAAGV